MFGRRIVSLLIATCCIHLSHSLFEDQVSKWDFRQRFVGRLKHLPSFDATSQTIVISTEKNVLVSIFLKNGSINWRQVLENEVLNTATKADENGNVITVNGNGLHVRSWSQKTGGLNWERTLPENIVTDDERNNANFHFYVKRDSNELFIAKHYSSSQKLQFYNFDYKMQIIKELRSFDVDKRFAMNDCGFVNDKHFVCLDLHSLQINHFILNVEENNFENVLLSHFGLRATETPQYLKLVTFSNQPDVENPYLAIDLGGEGHVLAGIFENRVKLVKIFPKVKQLCIQSATFADSDSKYGLFMLITRPESLTEDDSDKWSGKASRDLHQFKIAVFDMQSWKEDKSLMGHFTVKSTSPIIVNSMFIIPLFQSQKYSYKILVSTVDGSLFVSSPQGRITWKREEALAAILSADILDLPLSELDATIEATLGFSSENIIKQFVNRISSQIIQLQTYFTNVVYNFRETLSPSVVKEREDSSEIAADFDTSDAFSGGKERTLVRDKFGLHKIIVAVTELGKVFGIDTLSGKIIWSFYNIDLSSSLRGNAAKKLQMFVQRSTAHFPYTARCTVVTRNGLIVSFNPITGEVEDQKSLNVDVKQTMLLHHVDETYLKGVLILDISNSYHLYPSTTSSVFLSHKNKYFIVAGDESTGFIEGFGFQSVDEKQRKAARVWSSTLPTSESSSPQKLQIVFKKHGEHVHSQGRVLGDRSVLYKYLNPNLMVVTTEGTDSTISELGKKSNFITIYLIDAVTGSIVYSSVHRRSRGPVFVVHSENSVVYSFYNEKSRRTEISSLELYEGKTQLNATSFSSLHREVIKPAITEHQSFIFPTGILAMVDTTTEKGITNKHLLIALPSGGILELPKAFVDPRRPIHPTVEHREEGLIPYVPELPIPSEGIINYNKSIVNVRDIITAPSSLESTCLVFAFGLDIFYTRVTPSKTFDILKDDFDHWLIAGVLFILLGLSYVSKWLASRKTLNNAWK